MKWLKPTALQNKRADTYSQFAEIVEIALTPIHAMTSAARVASSMQILQTSCQALLVMAIQNAMMPFGSGRVIQPLSSTPDTFSQTQDRSTWARTAMDQVAVAGKPVTVVQTIAVVELLRRSRAKKIPYLFYLVHMLE